MWEHYCKVEKSLMKIGDGEECNWCGLTESTDPVRLGDTKQLLIDENDTEGTLIQE
jgi:hypothetical protein